MGEVQEVTTDDKASVLNDKKNGLTADPLLLNPILSDCVMRDLAKINGKINRMTRKELTDKLRLYSLDTSGNDDVLKKRLKQNYKVIKLANVGCYLAKNLLPYYIIIDFEATCNEVNPPDFPHEIIEFPAVLVNSKTLEIEDTFQMFCKPQLNPELSDFCVELTGVTQEQVDKAEAFPVVLKKFENWLQKHELDRKNKYAIVTDGPWDMSRFLFRQCLISKIAFPNWAKKWINLRKAFSNFYKCKRICLKDMLDYVNIGFEGRPHCGLDDSKNIARLLIRLMCDGANVHINERIHADNFKKSWNSFENIVKLQSDMKNDKQKMPGWGNWNKGNKKQVEASVKSVNTNQDLGNVDEVRRERTILEVKTAKKILRDITSYESINEKLTVIDEKLSVINLQSNNNTQPSENVSSDSKVTVTINSDNEKGESGDENGWNVVQRRTRHGKAKPKKKKKHRY